jgi:hypothetical protein
VDLIGDLGDRDRCGFQTVKGKMGHDDTPWVGVGSTERRYEPGMRR